MDPKLWLVAGLTDDDRQALQDWLTEFEQTWSPERLSACAADLPPEESPLRRLAVIGMAIIDLRHNWNRGKQVMVEQYVKQFPELRDASGVPVELLQDEFEVRKKLGFTVSINQFALRFPAHASVIRTWGGGSSINPAAKPASAPPALAGQSTVVPIDETVGRPPLSPAASGELTGSFGRYLIERLLGRGGMGTVYLALDTQLDRRVALKVPHFSDGDGNEVPARFRQEARAAAALSNPHICSVFDVGQISGIHYLTMAYIEGQTLASLLKGRKPLATPRAVDLVRRVALALDYAHRHNVIHRDLKPSNIMIDDRGDPVIMDFGLARQSGKDGTRLTLSGEALGTLSYMPPEQLRGDLSQMGPHSDVYSLGVILFEALTGRLPYEGAMAEVVHKRLTEAPPHLDRYQPSLAGSPLDGIVQRAMERSIEHRYPTMKSLAEALADTAVPATLVTSPPPAASARHATFQTVVSDPKSDEPLRPAPLRGARRRSSPIRAFVVLAILAAIAGGGVAVWKIFLDTDLSAHQTSQTNLMAVADSSSSIPLASNEEGSPDSDGRKASASDAAKPVQVQVPKLTTSPTRPVTPAPPPKDPPGTPPINAAQQWKKHLDAAKAKLDLRDLDGARADLDVAIDAATGNSQRAEALLLMSRVNFERNDFTTAVKEAERVIRLDPKRKGEAVVVLAQIYCESWDFDKAIEACDRVDAHDSHRPWVQAHLALALAGNSNWPAAERVVSESSTTWDGIAAGYRARAMILLRDYRNTQVVELLDRAATIDPKDALVYILRGRAKWNLRKFDEAIADFETANKLTNSIEPVLLRLQVYDAKLRNPPLKQVEIEENGVVRIASKIEKLELNPEAIDEALTLVQPSTAAEWSHVAALLRMKKDNVKAAEAYDKAVALLPNSLRARNYRATYHRTAGIGDHGFAEFRRILEIHPTYAPAIWGLGEIALKKNDLDAALNHFEDCERSSPRYINAIHGHSVVHMRRKNYLPAIEVSTVGLNIDPDNVALLSVRSYCRMQANELDLSIEDLNHLLDLSPGNTNARANRGEIYFRRERYDDAIQEFTTVIDIDPQNYRAMNDRGVVYNAKNMPEKAIDDYSAALRVLPTFELGYRNRAIAYQKLGMTEEAANDRRIADDLRAGRDPFPTLPAKSKL